MKTIIYFLIILSFSNCNNRREPVLKSEKTAKTASKIGDVDRTETDNLKTDTLIKKSNPFKINGMDCFWELKLFIRDGNNGGDGILALKNTQSKRTILTNSDYYSLDNAYYANSFNGIDFESLNKDAVKDLNFDGYKDCMIYGLAESGSAGSFYKVYLFNNEKKIFELSEAVSGYDIAIDTVSKTLSSGGRNGYGYNISATDYFGRKGKIKYTEITEREVISGEPKRLLKTTYKKIIDKKIIETKMDTVNFEGW